MNLLHAMQHRHAHWTLCAQARAVLQFYGVAYTVGDFAVCVGRAMMRPGEELRGYMVEVEYLPVQAPRMAQAALQARPIRLPSPSTVHLLMPAPQLTQAALQVRI